jgi:hypothetical protein
MPVKLGVETVIDLIGAWKQAGERSDGAVME